MTKSWKRLNKVIQKALRSLKAPEDLSLSEWSDKYMYLSRESSAEPGKYRTARTPYMKEPMDSFTDPKINHIVVVASSQVGKSQFELNALGYIIDQDPGSIFYVCPTIKEAEKFVTQRIEPLIRDNPKIRKHMRRATKTKSGGTKLQKAFDGGVLTVIGSQRPEALASAPVRYIIGDERDRWAPSAGREGDPWLLAKRRQTTYFNAKSIEVSTPVERPSNIEKAYMQGTQERWCTQCPDCGEWSEINFDSLRFDQYYVVVNKKKEWHLKNGTHWMCPHCGCLHSEDLAKKQPQKWIADNPDAYENGTRSFWLNGFCSPWKTWDSIVLEFLEANGAKDYDSLKTVFNTLLGQLWDPRDDMPDESEILSRREDYGRFDDGTPIEVPKGALVLTCGVDTQGDRFEYEVVGHGRFGEKWGIKYGVIPYRPDSPEAWQRLDDVISHVYRSEMGVGMKISATFIDSGGTFTQEVYEHTRERRHLGVRAIKGKSDSVGGIPYVQPPNKVAVRGNPQIKCDLYTIGVDAGKDLIMYSMTVENPGPRYYHYPNNPDCNYDERYFSMLLSEHKVPGPGGRGWKWDKIKGHERNEALDVRNYANAAFNALDPDLDAVEQRLFAPREKTTKPPPQATKKRRRTTFDQYDGW